MRFGLQIGWQDAAQLRDVAQAAEGLGFDAVYFPDHLVHEGPERQRVEEAAYDPIVQAAVVAGCTRRVRIGHLVLCNLFRHPAVTARSLATLDEALTCIRGLWTAAPFSFTGEFYDFREAVLLPRPRQRPHPPFLLGGSGRGLLRIAARHADNVNIVAATGREGYIAMKEVGKLTDATFRGKVGFLREEAARAGRDATAPEVSQTLFTVMLTDGAAATRQNAEMFGGMLGLPPDEVLRSPLTLIGTPEECVVELQRRRREWGIAETIVSARDEGVLRRFAEEVIARV